MALTFHRLGCWRAAMDLQDLHPDPEWPDVIDEDILDAEIVEL